MRKRLLVRADDVGYTETFDLGIRIAIDNGIVTSADVMLDSPDTVNALIMLKERPWISIGWHRHLWESPVLPASNVPSLVDIEGRFKWRHNKQHLKKECTYEDIYKELCAELDRCFDIYGAYPDAATVREINNPVEMAMKDVCKKYRINTLVWDYIGERKNNERDRIPYSQQSINTKLEKYGLDIIAEYNPINDVLSLTWSDESVIQRTGGHPGFLDDHIWQESTCTVHRIKEHVKMVSPITKQFIIDNKIELLNARDVIYGTNEYQNHLREANSPLWIGNMK